MLLHFSLTIKNNIGLAHLMHKLHVTTWLYQYSICYFYRDFERLPWHNQRRRRVSVLSGDPFSDEDLPKVEVKFGHPETETDNEDHLEKTVKKKTRRKRSVYPITICQRCFCNFVIAYIISQFHQYSTCAFFV